MNGENRDRTSSSLTPRYRPSFDLNTVRRMLPLIRRIVEDIVHDSAELRKFQFEQEGLDRNKISLSWPERQRRYYVHGEVTRLQGRLDEERRELDDLGAVLFNPAVGSVGFPTTIYGRPAYFDWQLGEEVVAFWHYDGESIRRPIPSSPGELLLQTVASA